MPKRFFYLVISVFLAVFFQPTYAKNDQFEFYTFNAGPGISNPVAIRLNTRTGSSSYFNGTSMQAIKEYGRRGIYKDPNYSLSTVSSQNGEVVFRFSRTNGAVWLYQQKGWVMLKDHR